MNKQLINFYCFGGTDSEGRSLKDVHSFSMEQLEKVHDYIQWLFPTKTASKFNQSAPILDKETANFLKYNRTFKENFQKSVKLFENFLMNNRHWHSRHDHNLLRITRYLESLTLLGFEGDAVDFYLDLLCNHENSFISEETIQHWKNALNSSFV
jgi:hypothetical protein